MRHLLCWLLVSLPAWAEPPQTQLMYLSPALELKLAVAMKREYYPWPALKVGIGQFGETWFGHIRFLTAPGAGKAQILRQCRQACLLAFRMFDKIVQIDIDASPTDDSAERKATPWFAASLKRSTALTTPLQLPPQSWFEIQGPITLRSDLHSEGDPPLSMAQALTTEWAKPLAKPVKPVKPK